MEDRSGKPDTLVVLWSSGDREVATRMVFMYTLNAKRKGWWH
ncbi:MAG: DsrE family protein, partial [Deltaproteobacteria bacterium]